MSCCRDRKLDGEGRGQTQGKLENVREKAGPERWAESASERAGPGAGPGAPVRAAGLLLEAVFASGPRGAASGLEATGRGGGELGSRPVSQRSSLHPRHATSPARRGPSRGVHAGGGGDPGRPGAASRRSSLCGLCAPGTPRRWQVT